MAAYISPEEAAKAKQMDLFTYLSLAQPDELIHKGGNHYTTKSHDSLDISNGFWKRWSTGDGGKTAIDYLIKVEGYSFQEAVQKVNSLTGFNPWDVRPTEQKKSTVKKEFILPEKNTDNKRVIAYLKSRDIHSDVLQYCIKHQYLYEKKSIIMPSLSDIATDKPNMPFCGALVVQSSKEKLQAATKDTDFLFPKMPAPVFFMFMNALLIYSPTVLCVKW